MDRRVDGKDFLLIEIFLSEKDKYKPINPYTIKKDKVTFEKRIS